MPIPPESLDAPPARSLDEARACFAEPERREQGSTQMLGAAALCAASAIALAAAVILGPTSFGVDRPADPGAVLFTDR